MYYIRMMILVDSVPVSQGESVVLALTLGRTAYLQYLLLQQRIRAI